MAKLPEKIDKYKIEKLVAAGGMGEVYKGIHPTLNRHIILKKLTLRGNAAVTERFRREAQILMDFRNDNIVDVQDHFIQGRSHYIVMEYIDGPSLKDLLEEQRYLDNCTAAYICLHTADALRYAHSKSVVHRDVKPANILISKKGEVKLADFGIASTRDPDTGEDTLTTEGTTLGTPAYMAPEQFENSRTVDHRADLYSLGVMMYEMLTGQKPFPGGFNPETIRTIQKGRYKKPKRINPSIDRGLQRIISSLIRPKPGSRCKDINIIINKLETWLKQYDDKEIRERLCLMVKEETPPPLQKKRRRKVKPVVTIAAIALAAAGLIMGWFSLTGIHKRILKPSEYGVIRITTGSTDNDTAYLPKAKLFIDDGKEYPSAEIPLRFLPGRKKITSLPAAVPAGKYRLKIILGNRIYWTSMSVKPWEEKPEVRIIPATEVLAQRGPIEIGIMIHDAFTGWDLSDTAVVEVYKPGGFIPVKDTVLFSGEIYNFRISAKGYKPQEWVLKLNIADRALNFNTELTPIK